MLALQISVMNEGDRSKALIDGQILAPQTPLRHDPRRMGIALRRLRALLPDEVGRRRLQPHLLHRYRLPAPRLPRLPLHRLCPPHAARARLPEAHAEARRRIWLAAALLRLSPPRRRPRACLVASACLR